MCGLAGFMRWGESDNQTFEMLNLMGNKIQHRGPDAQGVWFDQHISLVHRRLSILDLSEAGTQPMHSGCGRYAMVFNGEIYNYQDLKIKLQAEGLTFQTQTDSEVLLTLYIQYGDACLQMLNGMFAFAIWDKHEERLFIARDRLGKKPLYFYHRDNHFAFASELKALMPLPWFEKELRHDAIQDFFFYQYIPDPKTVFTNAYKLPPGYYLEWFQGQYSQTQYWDLSFSNQLQADEEELSHQLRELIDDAVRIRMISDVPLGAFLSGGVDSSAVVASMAMQSKKPVTTCAIGFDSEKFDEIKYAKQIALQFNTDHHEFTVRSNVTERFLAISKFFDEPFADPSFVPTFFVAELARQSVTVALAGDGGDESFAGYEKYRTDAIEQQIRSKTPSGLRRLSPFMAKIAGRLPGVTAKKAQTLLNTVALQPEQGFFLTNSFFCPLLWQRLVSRDFNRQLQGYDSSDLTAQAYHHADTDVHLNKIIYTDVKTYLPGDILVKVDRMTMASALEARAPLLDYRIVEFAAKVPPELKLKGNEKKHLLKQSQKQRLSDDILYRKKMGFSVPLAEWLCHELKPIVEQLLLAKDAGIVNFFDQQQIVQLWQQHLAGDFRYTQELWSLLAFEAWWQHYIESSAVEVHA